MHGGAGSHPPVRASREVRGLLLFLVEPFLFPSESARAVLTGDGRYFPCDAFGGCERLLGGNGVRRLINCPLSRTIRDPFFVIRKKVEGPAVRRHEICVDIRRRTGSSRLAH